jgi:hypothetical protein
LELLPEQSLEIARRTLTSKELFDSAQNSLSRCLLHSSN